MTKRLTALSALLSLTMATAGFAQTTDDTSESDAQTAAPAAEIEQTLSLGEDATLPKVGDVYLKETIQDWELQCIRVEEGQTEPCQMFQLLTGAEDNPVAEITIFRLPEGGQVVAGATIIVPLGTSLQEQLVVAVDGGSPRRYPYAYCDQVGCHARLGLTDEDVARFKRGAVASMKLASFFGQEENVTISLKGFTAAFEKSVAAAP